MTEKKTVLLSKVYADAFVMFLKASNINYYISKDGLHYYFRRITETESLKINDFVNSLNKVFCKGAEFGYYGVESDADDGITAIY